MKLCGAPGGDVRSPTKIRCGLDFYLNGRKIERFYVSLFSRNIEMKTIVVSLLGTILGLFGCNAQSASFRSVNAREFAEVISDSTVFVLDVRTAEEYAAGHIGNAVNIDVLQDDFKEKAVARIPEGKTVALYCRSGNRSKKAANMLSGKYKVVELATGWTGWNAEFGRNE